ncbi:hypothetical protein XENOCAPTIV_029427 [Xenoophorus captivus]|uniref:Uncharacterized protein n=1 Tax=Xenoophorus captivus TaxID=1517983 RepID=A0ABV0S3T9_9TELE
MTQVTGSQHIRCFVTENVPQREWKVFRLLSKIHNEMVIFKQVFFFQLYHGKGFMFYCCFTFCSLKPQGHSNPFFSRYIRLMKVKALKLFAHSLLHKPAILNFLLAS